MDGRAIVNVYIKTFEAYCAAILMFLENLPSEETIRPAPIKCIECENLVIPPVRKCRECKLKLKRELMQKYRDNSSSEEKQEVAALRRLKRRKDPE